VIKIEMIFFIAVDGKSQAVRGGWPAVVVQIQYFGFSSKVESMGRSITEK
jgi:hypothetical protein